MSSHEIEVEISLSCDSLSYDEDQSSSSEEEGTIDPSDEDSFRNRGLQPCQFELSDDENDVPDDDSDDISDEDPRASRLNNSNW